MRTVDVEIRNPSGLHARPAALFVRAAAAFKSTVTVQNLTSGKPPVNAKSLIAVLSAGLLKGATIRISADGEDEDQAAADLEAAIKGGLGESVE
jgi:phosphotransferase system HPr (HPr) family protein